MTPEGKVKKLVTALLKEYGDEIYYNMPVPSGYGESMLDYVGCINGAFFMVETKREGKEPTPRQQECRRRVLRAGGAVFRVNDEVSLEDLRIWLELASGRFTGARLKKA